jgi:GNAT superfamily N-acetyltransferase
VEKTTAPYSIRVAREEDKPRILPLLADLAPQLDPMKRWAWMYENNPEGHAITYVAVDEESGEIAGVTSYFPLRLWAQGKVVRAALGGDGYVPPKFRRRGIAAALHRTLRAEMPRHGIEVMFGAPAPANVKPLQQSGSRIIGETVRYLRPLTPSVFSRHAALADPIARILLSPRAGSAQLTPAGEGDRRIDKVWEATRGELAIATVRDAAFYRWRFHQAPAQVQRPYVVVDRSRPIALCALQEHAHHLQIIDLCAPRANWRAALNAIAREAGNAASISFKLLRDDGERRRLWRHGYIAREGRPYLAVAPEGSPRADLYYDGKRWTYMDADIDIDNFR